MSRVERFFERLVERPSARLFRTRLQPLQILRRIERAMEAERGAEGRHGLVPDQFTVRLHPADLAALLPADDVASDLASGALSFARAHGYALRERPRVTLRPDPGRRPGEVEIDTAVSPPAEPAGDEALEGGTRVFEVPVVRAPAITLEIREPGRSPRRVPMSGTPIRIGRAPECELVLKDNRVSRRHARLAPRNGVLILTDLGSTNGTRVNGHRVTEVVLGAGDRVQIGETSLVVETVPAAADQAAAGPQAGVGAVSRP
ncbi:MAG TPA: FhaA domain-containing protein [Candidatus Limnocylindrales bacterium]|nr:FhaA domain-containing protein [Candidatus Limnocylindrales bacterium]